MKNSNKILRLLSLLAVGAALSFSSCSKDPDDTEAPVTTTDQFAIVGGIENPAASYLLSAGSLTTGSVTAAGNGAEITGWSRLFKNGYYYILNNNKLTKNTFDNKTLTPTAELAVTGNALNAYWLDDATLLIAGGTSTAVNPIMNYTIVNVENMSITKTGSFGQQPLGPTDKALYLSACVLRGSKLYVGYTIFKSTWTSNDTSYLASADYPSMNNVKITKDIRSTYPGSFASIMPSTIKYNNDIYMITNPGDRWGVNPDKPAAIFRLKNGEDAFATDYFWDLSAISDGNREYYGLWDLGNGKGITRVGRKDLLTTFTDYTTKDVFEYYVIDVVNKTRTKLNLPLDRVVLTSPVWVEGGKAYIAISSATEGHFVWTYDIATGSLTKGLEIKGTDNVTWLSRLK